MKRLLLALALLAPLSASAKDITVTLGDDDQNTIAQALDAYVKTGGIQVATRAVMVLQKLTAAINAPPKSDKPDAIAPEAKPAP
jgi:hypothetical protein